MSDVPVNRPEASATGTLGKTPAIHLLLYCLEKRLTGTVEFTGEGGASGEPAASVLFVRGQPAKARTPTSVSYLGRVLVELGLLSNDDLNHSLGALARAKNGGQALHGQVLLASGSINEDALHQGLSEQLARSLRYVAALPAGTTFAYYEGFNSLAEWGAESGDGYDPIPMIWGMLRESPPQAHVRAALEHVSGSRLRLIEHATIGRLGLSEESRGIVERLADRSMRVADLLVSSSLGEAETRLLIYLLLVTKQVDLLRANDSPSRLRAAAPASASKLRAASPPAVVTAKSPPPVVTAKSPPPVVTAPSHSTAPAPRTSSTSIPAIRTTPSGGTPVGPPSASTPAASAVASTPPSQPPRELAPELAERWKEIVERATSIDRADYFMMLDLARDASVEEVEATFFTLAKKWHPDRLPPELAPVRTYCSRVFARMSEAHATLSDSELRGQYMNLLADGSGSPDVRETVAKVIEAATDFQKAEVCLRRSDYAQAEVLCRKALEADGTQPDYLAMLAWLLALKPENQTADKTKDSIAMLDRAIAMSGRSEKAFFWRGMLNKRLGRTELAFRDFKTSAELNPRNIDAAREVRLHRMRRGPRSSSPPPLNPSRSVPPPGSARPKPSSVRPEEPKPSLLGRFFKKT
jgi:tetratricopeptide (TPR) repeat protein